MTDTSFVCGLHAAEVWERGGETFVGDLVPLTEVRWQRIRDEVSVASVIIPTTQCCELLGDLRTILHELHIVRNGVTVWQGPITRLEYEWAQVQIFAEDVLWQTKRTVLNEGYDQTYPAVGNVVDRVDWLLRDQCFALHSDPWNVVSHLHPMRHVPADEPKTTRKVNAYQMYVWEDVDKYAEDYGVDYTVVNRDVYYFDTHLAWMVLPPLDEEFISQFPRIVEYGNQAATVGYVTDGQGYAGIATGDTSVYGWVDWLISNAVEEGTAVDDAPPTAGEIAQWAGTAGRNLEGRNPAPLSIVIPANTTLMPGAPWTIDDLIPGAWFEASITLMCRTVTEWHRLHEVVVSEAAPSGETVQFSSVSAPAERVDPL